MPFAFAAAVRWATVAAFAAQADRVRDQLAQGATELAARADDHGLHGLLRSAA
jgi:hypothetical protein